MIIAIGSSYGMFEYTKQYSFCKGCHEMNQAHDTWMASKHGPILSEIDSCIACHAEEGALGYVKAKLSGFRSVYYHITGQITGGYLEVAKGSKPVYCLKTGCHSISDLDKGLKIRVNHKSHSEMGFKCVNCHDRIAHGWDEVIRSSPSMKDTCFDCHDNKTAPHNDCGLCHLYQKKMLAGGGEEEMEQLPSPHAEHLGCKDCHLEACATDLKICSGCHEDDKQSEIPQRQALVSLELEKLKGTLKQLERIINNLNWLNSYNISLSGEEKLDSPIKNGEDKYKKRIDDLIQLYRQIKKNYESISRDLSRGAHNFEYTWKLLNLSEKKANEVILFFSKKKMALN